jgi:hypothetical protein
VRQWCEGSGGETHIVGKGVKDGEPAAEVLGSEERNQKTTLLGVLLADSTDKSSTKGETATQEVVGVRIVQRMVDLYTGFSTQAIVSGYQGWWLTGKTCVIVRGSVTYSRWS